MNQSVFSSGKELREIVNQAKMEPAIAAAEYSQSSLFAAGI
jgi:hypothetical protein